MPSQARKAYQFLDIGDSTASGGCELRDETAPGATLSHGHLAPRVCSRQSQTELGISDKRQENCRGNLGTW